MRSIYPLAIIGHRHVALCLGVVLLSLAAPAAAHDLLQFADVQPILARNCGGSACHINQETNGVELTSYDTLMASVGQQYGTNVIVPGQPDLSPLIDKVENRSPVFGERMPFGGPYLSAGDVGTLRRWITEGAIRSHRPQRGDTDGDERLNVTDAVRILTFLFVSNVEIECEAQADADASGSVNISDAVFILNFLFFGGSPPVELTREQAEACEDVGELSFTSIYEKVLSASCAFSSCHDADDPKANLSFATKEAAHASLVGATPFNEVASAAGLLRVDPGRPDNSFLLKKLVEPGPGEGNRMPANSPVGLSQSTIDSIREWVLVGAPLEGTIDGVPDISDDPPAPVDRMPRPPVPENGVQLHLPAYPIGARRERQLHYFAGAPFADLDQEEIWVKRIDIHMLEQSHHFILYQWVARNDPRPGYREGTSIDINQVRLIAVSQQSFYSLSFPEGLGIKFDKNTRFDLNSHYINLLGDRTLMGEAYVNIIFAEPGSITTEVKPIFDFGGNIRVPPFETTTAQGLFPTQQQTLRMDPALGTSGRVSKETHIYALTSHMHRHGDRFQVFRFAGGRELEQVYDNFSWDDPEFTVYDPPLVLEPGEGLRYRATFTYDDPPSPSALPLSWGNGTSEDEMIILLGYYGVP